ncbi:MAG: hypothetical protein EBR09_09330 [Proteobacteria bacterium]|nr:hypothetical protein [Pseudomonadota bacterium]
MSNQDNTGRQLNVQQQPETENQQIQIWVQSLESLMDAVGKSSIDSERKNELLLHMAAIRNELASGQWPNVGDAGSMQTLVHEAGEIEQVAQDWQALSVRLAQWVKAISDSLGVK